MGNCTARPTDIGDVGGKRTCVVDLVYPARPEGELTEPRTLPLSPLDSALCVRGLVVYWAFMYAHELDPALLRAALAAALAEFPVLAGRARVKTRHAVRVDLEVVLNDKGVPFTTCESSTTLEDLTGPEKTGAITGRNNLTPPEFLTPIGGVRAESGRDALMAVKLTRLNKGGCVVGVSWVRTPPCSLSHIAADGSGMHAFIQNWTAHSKRLHAASAAAATAATKETMPLTHPMLSFDAEPHVPRPLANIPSPPSHDRLAILDGACADSPPFSELALDDPDKRLNAGCFVTRLLCGMGWRVTFERLSQQVLHIPAEDLALMKARLSARATSLSAGRGPQTSGMGYISTNDVVVVFVWLLMRKLRRESRSGQVINRGFMMQTIDMRGLGIRGLESNLFGNASVMVAAHLGHFSKEDDDDSSTGVMALSMRSAVNAFRSKSEAEHRGSFRALASASSAIHLKSVVTGVALSDAFMSAWQFPLWDVSFDGAVADNATSNPGKETADGSQAPPSNRGPVWFWGSVYPQAAWTSCVVPDGPANSSGKKPGVYVNVTVPEKSVSTLRSGAVSVMDILKRSQEASS